MTDSPAPDEAAATDGASDDDGRPTLEDLRLVGPATRERLAAADIDAAAIIDRSVTFVELVKVGVDPGVAGRLRREYSLPWSDVPTSGARLRRRANHIRHLRPDERSWIDASHGTDGSASTPANAAPDGSGSATDAEAAWRQRSRSDADSDRTDTVDQQPETAGRPSGHQLEVPPDMEPPINPTEHTVSELKEALDTIDEPIALAAVLEAERAGERRTTAVEAIENRMEAVGADPNEVTSQAASAQPEPSPRSVPSVRPHMDGGSGTDASTGGPASPIVADVTAQVTAWVDAGVAEFQRRYDAVERAARRQQSRFRQLEDEEVYQMSVALLLGTVVFSAMTALGGALQPAFGPPVGALSLFAVTLAVGVVSLPMRWWETPGGVGLTLLTGVLGLLAVGLVGVGTYGTVSSGTAWISLAAYAVIALALVVTTYASRQG